jgi:radical SAM protein with 4Fe4S-binding SPASM domain
MRLSTLVQLGGERIVQELREKAYLATGVDTTRPNAIGVVLTERCNYRCLSCACWRQPNPEELSFEQWTAAFADLQDFIGNYIVDFGGGEPFVFKPFLSIVDWCHAAGLQWTMTTNGSSFSEKTARRVAAARPLAINISVDGATSAVHDHSRGVSGSLATITRGIATLRAARDEAGASFPIRIKPTVHRQNFREMPALLRWAQEVGASSVDFSPVRQWTPEVASELWLRPGDEAALHEVVQTLLAMKRDGAPIETENARMLGWAAHFRGEAAVQGAFRHCRVGLRDYCILPNGDVRSCWFYPVLGNVTRSTAREIWRGASAQALRHEMTHCPNYGEPKCATSCLAHRSVAQDARRAMLVFRPRLATAAVFPSQ